jgi:Ca2+/H+ antiporter, TMEM165/GDT1 family
MDWKTVVQSFAAIFLAELGDKTQLATFAMSAAGESRGAIFVGAAGALVTTSAIGVLLGEAVGGVVPAAWVRRGAGVLFIAIGLVYLLRAPVPG